MKRQYLIGITIATILPILSVGAATASFLPGGIGDDWQSWINQTLGNPLDQVQQQISKGDEILGQIMKGSLGSAWDEAKGKTGGSQQPDPYQVRTADTAIAAGVLTTNPIVHKRDAANLYDQELSRATAAPVLGDTGRKWLEQEAKKTGAIVQNNQQGTQVTQKLAQEAQGLSVTQDVMKNNAKQLSSLAGILNNQSKLTAENQTSLLRLQQLQGTIAQLTANTSEGIDETNRRDRVVRQIELSSATHAEIYIPGLLRTNQANQPMRR
jgi:hypothetical protein